jgi:hypothetical protein
MGRTAHLPAPADPSCLTFAVSLEKWKGRASPFRRNGGGNHRLPRRPRRAGGVSQRVPGAARAGAARALREPRAHRCDRARSPHRTDALRAQHEAGAAARVEREARDDLRGADLARPLVPHRDRRARQRSAERDDVAGEPGAQGLRRSGAVVCPAQLARAPGGGRRDPARHGPGSRRRELVRHAPHRDRLEAGLLSPRVAGPVGADRQSRLDGPVRDEAAGADGRPALPDRPAPRRESPRPTPCRSRTSSRRLSRLSCATWTSTATTSTPRCC